MTPRTPTKYHRLIVVYQKHFWDALALIDSLEFVIGLVIQRGLVGCLFWCCRCCRLVGACGRGIGCWCRGGSSRSSSSMTSSSWIWLEKILCCGKERSQARSSWTGSWGRVWSQRAWCYLWFWFWLASLCSTKSHRTCCDPLIHHDF